MDKRLIDNVPTVSRISICEAKHRDCRAVQRCYASIKACERSGSGRNFRSSLTPLSVTPAHRSVHRSAPAPLRSAPHRGVSNPIIALKRHRGPSAPENIRKR